MYIRVSVGTVDIEAYALTLVLRNKGVGSLLSFQKLPKLYYLNTI